MSRCFPFPPPGYEKKARIDDADLLEKEKQKEKKQKKEKKDKEKREGKEKKEKDKNKEKHKDKKDRKEKHKEKDKDRDKEKNRGSDAKKSEPRTGIHNGEKLESNSFKTSDVKDSKHVQELAKRIRDEDGASGSQVVESVAAPDDRRVELARKIRDSDGASGSQMVEKIASDERKVKLPGMAAETIVNKKPDKEKVKDKKEDHRKANGQENHVGARGEEKMSDHVPSRVDQERGEPITKPLAKENIEKHVEGKEKGEPITKPLPKENVDKHVEGKEKSKHKEREGKGDKHKHKDRDKGKDKKSKDKDGDKEKKTEEKAKENKESSKEHTKSKGSDPKLKENAKESLDFRNTKLPDLPKLSNPGLPSDGTLGKRKEPEKNGYLLDEENRPNKSSKHLSLHQPVTETEKKPELIPTATELGGVLGASNNHVVVGKDIKINGFILPQQHNETLAKPAATQTPGKPAAGQTPAKPAATQTPAKPAATQTPEKPAAMQTPEKPAATQTLPKPAATQTPPKPSTTHSTKNENGEASVKVKPPHPDTKYLSQIFCVPVVEDLPDSLDQEWLLGNEHQPSKKLKVGSPAANGTLQVWSEAVRIESADISALPYVIPY